MAAAPAAPPPAPAYVAAPTAYAPPPSHAAPPAPHYAPPPQVAPSLAIQPGETTLGSWNVNNLWPDGPTIVGKLIVTNRRILFDPKTEAHGVLWMAATLIGRAQWKKDNMLVIDKDQVVEVRIDGMVEKHVQIWLANGVTFGFSRGMMMSVDPIAAAIQQRG